MPPMQGNFDATNIPPQQGTAQHPPGMFDFMISHTEIKENKDKTGGYLEVEFSSPAGRAYMRYNLWNQSAVAVEIANKQLSALCHATGVFRLDFANEAAALRNARGRMEVGPQKDDKFTEIKRVFDTQGNEPGKSNTAPQQSPQVNPAPNPAPMTQAPGGGGWGNAQQPPNNPAPSAGAPQGWGNANQAPQQPSSPPANNWQQPGQSPPNGQPQQPQPGNAPNRPAWAG